MWTRIRSRVADGALARLLPIAVLALAASARTVPVAQEEAAADQILTALSAAGILPSP